MECRCIYTSLKIFYTRYKNTKAQLNKICRDYYSNKGIELELGYRETFGDLKLDVSLTGGFNKNEVLSIDNQEKKLQDGTGGHGQSGIIVAQVGKPMGYFSGYQTEGLFQDAEQLAAHKTQQSPFASDGRRHLEG